MDQEKTKSVVIVILVAAVILMTGYMLMDAGKLPFANFSKPTPETVVIVEKYIPPCQYGQASEGKDGCYDAQPSTGTWCEDGNCPDDNQ